MARTAPGFHFIPQTEQARSSVFVLYKNPLFRDLITQLISDLPQIIVCGATDCVDRGIEAIRHAHARTVVLEGSGHNAMDRALFGFLMNSLAEAGDLQLLMLDLNSREPTSWHWKGAHHVDATELRALVLAEDLAPNALEAR